MSAPARLISELEAMIQHASPERRARTLRRIGTFFLAGLGFWNDGHIRLSDHSLFALVERAQGDGVLAEKVGLRPDIPPRLFSNLLQNASGKAPLHASARPPTAFETLRQQDRLDEAAVVDFANTGRYQEMIAALVWLCAVPIEVLDRLMGSERPDPIFILCKSMDWEWSTAKAILMARTDNASSADLDAAIAEFNRLSPSTVRRVSRI